jgi:hypothetical protein
MTNTQAPSIEFTAQDRCDRCIGQAYIAYRKDTLELQFCLHHGKQHNVALEVDGWQPYFDYNAIERLVEPERVLA